MSKNCEERANYYLYIDGQAVPVSEQVYRAYQHYERKEEYFSYDLKTEKFQKETATFLPSREDSYERLFRSLMNDYHLKDLSGKIKSVLYAKKKSGQDLTAYAPYGYRKSDEDKHRLVVDEEAAAVVREICLWQDCSSTK